jgi:hypothetical protein
MKFPAIAWVIAGVLAIAAAQEETTDAGRSTTATLAVVERPASVVGFNVDGASVRDMFIRGLLAAVPASSPADAMRSLGITPKDTVGIKISTDGGVLFSTKRALVGAIIRALTEAGVPPRQIIIWDKHEKVMRAAEWPPSAGGKESPAVTNVVPETWWDPKVFYLNEEVGKLIYGDFQFVGKAPSRDDLLNMARQAVEQASREKDSDAPNVAVPEDQISNKSFYAKLVTQQCTKIINVPVLSDDTKAGLHGCLSSIALASVDNTRRFTGAGNWGVTAVPEILDKEFMREKIVLHVLDSLIAQYAGGPKFDPAFCESPGTLYVSRDPVAIDTLALEKIEALRLRNKIDPLGGAAAHVKVAADYGLGVNNRKSIKILKIP